MTAILSQPTPSTLWTLTFVTALTLATGLRLWLAARQYRHVAVHRDQVPAAFAATVPLADHQKAADYTLAKLRLGFFELAVEVLLLLFLTLGGGLAHLATFWQGVFPPESIAYGLSLFASVGAIGLLVDLPFAYYRSFGIESRFGFNTMTPALFFADLAKQVLLAIVLGAPLASLVLWLMAVMGSLWWLWTWVVWLAFNLLLLWLYPSFIAPLFNRFTPLPDGALKQRIEALLARCGFQSSGLYIMDGSKRSRHGNAYFTGFGKAKRIVFFDTLIEKLTPEETEAVLAHELGHYRLRHVLQRLLFSTLFSFLLLALLGKLLAAPWFYEGLGVNTLAPGKVGDGETAIGLILFSLVLPVFVFPLTPLFAYLSRRHEFAADAFAARHAPAMALVSALVKLHRENAATLTPDPLYAVFYASHPPAAERIAHLQAQAVPT